jgi:hypothetical protein
MIVSTRQEGKRFFLACVSRRGMPQSLDDLIEKSR